MLGQIIQERGLESIGRFYSKYRGIVVDNNDPDNLNRVKVTVPEVSLEISEWAFPLNQCGSTDSGFKWLVPRVGSVVWVDYKNGDPLYPLWSYHGWAIDEIPEDLKDNNTMGFVTNYGHKFLIKDDEGILDITMVDPNDVSKVNFNIRVEGNAMKVTGDSIVLLNNGHGVPLSDKLVEKINTLEKELNNLKELFLQTVANVKPSDGGASAFSFLASQYSKKLNITQISDIENPKIKQ